MRFSKKKNIISEKIDNGEILFDTERLTFYSLNPVGADIWRFIDKLDYLALIDKLKNKYDVKLSVLKKDVNQLLEELKKEELLVIRE